LRAKQICERKTHTFDYSFSPTFERQLYSLGIREYAWDNLKKVFQIKLNNHPELLKYLEVKNEWEFWEKLNKAYYKNSHNFEEGLENLLDDLTKELIKLSKRKYYAL